MDVLMTKKKRSMGQAKKLKDTIFVYLLIALPLIEFFTIYVYTNIDSFFLAFKRNGEFAGWVNFEMLWNEVRAPGSELLIAIRNTFIYFGADLVLFVWSIFLSYFFYKKIAAYKAFRFILYMPAIISPVVFVSLFQNITNPNGAIETIIKMFNSDFKMPSLLFRSETATWTMVVYVIWMGWTKNMLYLGGSLARIPVEVLESARLDGVGPWTELTKILVPLLLPTLSTLLLLDVVGILSSSGPILLFTKGAYETTTISYWMFTMVYATGENAYAKASAAGMCLTVIMFPVVYTMRWLIGKIDSVEY
ncbi:MAG: sugar ABC transporter permease [Clostridia bacterium]|nr:sugar ABC transporter permease [Clostridia bacterium]